eukprot:CAMPEP_0170547668 /NCGR_PEP_ID=MMETSP0211-20121228/6041_1 /TAXON_ID=311385 /ORGANISM="Pseudokeronopsis sp., Strain OXSARD2" /LENGTH=234 /DNA_ID=CAMNT_0010852817 /DNA_START=231 /DNA_END=935 /DNA_ORIENTATION=+
MRFLSLLFRESLNLIQGAEASFCYELDVFVNEDFKGVDQLKSFDGFNDFGVVELLQGVEDHALHLCARVPIALVEVLVGFFLLVLSLDVEALPIDLVRLQCEVRVLSEDLLEDLDCLQGRDCCLLSLLPRVLILSDQNDLSLTHASLGIVEVCLGNPFLCLECLQPVDQCRSLMVHLVPVVKLYYRIVQYDVVIFVLLLVPNLGQEALGIGRSDQHVIPLDSSSDRANLYPHKK